MGVTLCLDDVQGEATTHTVHFPYFHILSYNANILKIYNHDHIK